MASLTARPKVEARAWFRKGFIRHHRRGSTSEADFPQAPKRLAVPTKSAGSKDHYPTCRDAGHFTVETNVKADSQISESAPVGKSWCGKTASIIG